MAAVLVRFRAELRSRRRAWFALTLLAGVLGGLVVALWAGAARTSVSYRHYIDATNAADVYVDPGVAFGDDSLDLRRVARLPQVVYSEGQLVMAVISRSRSGRPVLPSGPDSVQYQVPSDGRPADRIDTQKILDGRLPDPSRADEALGDTKSMRTLGLKLGDTLTFRGVRQSVLLSSVQDFHLTSDPLATHVGPLVRVRIVGIAANARSEVDGGLVRLTPGYYRRYGGLDVGHFVRELAVRLRHGSADIPAFRAAVHRVGGRHAYGFFERPREALPPLQRSIDILAGALRLVTGAAAIAAILLLGQALLREAATDLPAQAALRAIGMTRRQVAQVGVLRSAAIALLAAGLSVLVAFLVSPLAPIGRAGEVEPDPGFFFNASIVLPGAGIVFGVLLLLGVLGTTRVVLNRSEQAHPPPGAGRRIAAAAGRAGLPSSATAGVRMALVRRSTASAVPVRATLVAAIVAVGVTVAAITFAAGLAHLLRTPALYGQTWDFETGPGPGFAPGMLRAIVRDPGVAAVAVGTVAPVEIGGRPVGARAMDGVKGSVWPTVLHGRAPRAPGEALLGPKTLDFVHKSIGDSVVLRNGPRSVSVRISGSAAFPSTKWNKLGEGVALSFRTLRRIDPLVPRGSSEVRFVAGPARRGAKAHLVALFDGTAAVRPTEVGDFAGVNALPLIIAALFAAGAAAVLGHALVTSVRRRGRDIAILKTIGFTRPQVAAAVAWQATTVAAIGLLIGVPIGLLAGRFGWNQFATGLGVVPAAVTPVALTALIVPAAVILANAIAALPGWAAARTRPAVALRAE